MPGPDLFMVLIIIILFMLALDMPPGGHTMSTDYPPHPAFETLATHQVHLCIIIIIIAHFDNTGSGVRD